MSEHFEQKPLAQRIKTEESSLELSEHDPQPSVVEEAQEIETLFRDPEFLAEECGLTQEEIGEVSEAYTIRKKALLARMERTLRAGVLALALVSPHGGGDESSSTPEISPVISPTFSSGGMMEERERGVSGSSSGDIRAHTSFLGAPLDNPETIYDPSSMREEVLDRSLTEQDPVIEYALREERERVMIRARIAEGFSREDTLLDFFHQLALESEVEHMAVYGTNASGEVTYFSYIEGSKRGGSVPYPELEGDEARKKGVKHLFLVHTHPASSIQTLEREGKIRIPPEGGHGLPPSSPDMHTATIPAYNLRYSPEWYEHPSGTYTFENVVIDPKGIWRYSVDPFNSAIKQSFSDALQEVGESREADAFLKKYPQVTKEKLVDLLRLSVSPDRLIRERTERQITELGVQRKDLSFLQFYFVNAGSRDPRTTEYEVTSRQIDVAEGRMSPTEFSEYFRSRGITVKHTPFSVSEEKQ